MKRLAIFIFLALTAISGLYSQNTRYRCLLGNNKSEEHWKGIQFYGGLTHQHQNFFNIPFSFTGIETGVFLKQNFLLGVYGSTFISNLEVDISNSKTHFSISQGGFVFGISTNSQKLVHAGMLLNIGYFKTLGNSARFSVFDIQNPSIKVGGVVIIPQAFTEINISKWMKFRTGLGYSFYNFEDHSIISKTDLQHISINFGFLFGRYI